MTDDANHEKQRVMWAYWPGLYGCGAWVDASELRKAPRIYVTRTSGGIEYHEEADSEPGQNETSEA